MRLLTEPEPQDAWHGAPVIARSDGWDWLYVPMMFNHRLVGTPEGGNGNPVYGWCYKSGAALVAAVSVWEPESQDEPLGWHKRAGVVRRAPHRELDERHNRDRCVHGTYTDELECQVAQVCESFPFRPLA